MGLSVSFDDPTRAARGSRGPYHATPPTEFRKWGQVHFHHFPAFPGTCREMDLSPFFGGGLRGEWDRGSGVGMSGTERVYAMENSGRLHCNASPLAWSRSVVMTPPNTTPRTGTRRAGWR